MGFSRYQNPDCVLCPRGRNEDRKKKPYPPADTFLRVCKPTEQQCWAHVLCAVFSPEITFADAARLRLIEGINTISNHRWSAVSMISYHPVPISPSSDAHDAFSVFHFLILIDYPVPSDVEMRYMQHYPRGSDPL